MEAFVRQDSIVRKIWGKSDTILLIFAGASAEFALNKAVDWLYFTGRLPADPLGRLFSTVSYSRKIVFLPYEEAIAAIDKIARIHKEVERQRNDTIPMWSYRDVLYMLIGYSISAFELLEHKLTLAEKEEVFDVFFRMGTRMGLEDLPTSYADWLEDRERHLQRELERSSYSVDLYSRYRTHSGSFRNRLQLTAQPLVSPPSTILLLGLKYAILTIAPLSS